MPLQMLYFCLRCLSHHICCALDLMKTLHRKRANRNSSTSKMSSSVKSLYVTSILKGSIINSDFPGLPKHFFHICYHYHFSLQNIVIGIYQFVTYNRNYSGIGTNHSFHLVSPVSSTTSITYCIFNNCIFNK